MRFTIRRLMIGVALVASLVAVAAWAIRWNDPAARYRRDHDAQSLAAVLSTRVENGDGIGKLKDLLGPLKRHEDPKLYQTMLVQLNKPGRTDRDGFQVGDDFYEFESGPGILILLQVRDGRLVNFLPKEYQGTDPVESKRM